MPAAPFRELQRPITDVRHEVTELTSADLIYLVALSMYGIFFLLFLRFFFWKTYAEASFWKRRPELSLAKVREAARQAGEELPFFSILVPARNEAPVIEKTIRHLADLRYPGERYEVIVVTDRKEQDENDALRLDYVLDTLQFFDYAIRGDWRGKVKPHVQSLVVALLTQLCLEEYKKPETVEPWLLQATKGRRASDTVAHLLNDLAVEIISRNGQINLNQVYRLFRRSFPGLDDAGIAQIYPNYLCLAVPICQIYARLIGQEDASLVRNAIIHAARANNRITQEIISRMCSLIGEPVFAAVCSLQAARQLKEKIDALYPFCYPTTQLIVKQIQREWASKKELPALKHVEVPADFDGNYQGNLTGRPVPSTKGRALNYALPIATDPRTVMCGFYDAESRPDLDVLLYVAWRRLTDETPVRILQGPVFQVRNFYEMGPFSKIASLYQSISHDWYLPVVFRRLPFVGGTNLFVEKSLLDELGGYDHQSLTEDLELGTRAYLAAGAWPEYLPYPSTEQTPPVYRAFYRQRLRWGTGHMQVMHKLANGNRYPAEKTRPLLRELWIKGPLEWVFYQFATLVPPVVLVLWLLGHVNPYVVADEVRFLLNILSLIYISFTYYAFLRYYKHVDPSGRPLTIGGRAMVAAQLLVQPLAAFFYPVPFTSALVLSKLQRAPTAWAKTPRSRE